MTGPARPSAAAGLAALRRITDKTHQQTGPIYETAAYEAALAAERAYVDELMDMLADMAFPGEPTP